MSSSLDNLYQEVILDHFKNPRCRGCLVPADASSTLFNPLCGDQVHVTVNCKDGVINDIRFEGTGCSISQASASMLSNLVEGKSIPEARDFIAAFRAMMRGEKTAEELEDVLGDVIALEGVRQFSARVKCAALAWEALEKSLEQLAIAA